MRPSAIAICLVAVLLGMAAAQSVLAQQPSGHHVAGSLPPGERGHGEAPKGTGPAAKDAKRPEHAPDMTGIDASVQTRRPAGVHNTSIGIGQKGPPLALEHRLPAGVTRNAIGLPVTSGGATQGPIAGRSGLRSSGQLPASLPPGIVSTKQDLAGPKIVTPNAQMPATVLSRGGLAGSVAARRGLALSGLGGPAKTAPGINGTAIRRKE